MLVTLFTTIALAASPALSLGLRSAHEKSSAKAIHRRQTEGFISWSWVITTPSPSDTNDVNSTYDVIDTFSNEWQVMPTFEAGIGLQDGTGFNFPPTKYGYRLLNDPPSSVIWHFNGEFNVVTAELSDQDDNGPFIFMNADLASTYASTTPTPNLPPSTPDPWLSASNGTVVPLNPFFSITNQGACTFGDGYDFVSLNFTATTVDGNGVTEVFTGTDNLGVPVPTVYPVTITVESDSPVATAVLTYNGGQPVSALLGGGANEPVVGVGLSGGLIYCQADDD